MDSKNILFTIARFAAAIIMLQTLYFKFSGAEESVNIFTQVGMEPWGRIATGTLELIASALLLYKAKSWLGALLALGLMGGAIVMHLTLLGIEVQNDGGYLFVLAMLVFACAAVVFILQKKYWLEYLKKWRLIA